MTFLDTELELAEWLSLFLFPTGLGDCSYCTDAILLLTKGKASGPDSLYAEHLLYGPCVLLSQLPCSLRFCYVPLSFCLSPILKDSCKDNSNPSNYRGIALSSVLSKILEICILNCIGGLLTLQMQGGFRSGFSSLHTSFILQEAIATSQELGYAAFLDARKAFDTVWHSGLLVKLARYGIPMVAHPILVLPSVFSCDVGWFDLLHLSCLSGC